MSSNNLWKGLTIAIVYVSVGSGALAVDIGMESYSPVPPPIYTRIPSTSVSGCGKLTSDEWFLLAVQIQDHRNRLDKGEQAFVDAVVNYMLTGTETIPTPEHKSWLCHLKTRLKL